MNESSCVHSPSKSHCMKKICSWMWSSLFLGHQGHATTTFFIIHQNHFNSLDQQATATRRNNLSWSSLTQFLLILPDPHQTDPAAVSSGWILTWFKANGVCLCPILPPASFCFQPHHYLLQDLSIFVWHPIFFFDIKTLFTSRKSWFWSRQPFSAFQKKAGFIQVCSQSQQFTVINTLHSICTG